VALGVLGRVCPELKRLERDAANTFQAPPPHLARADAAAGTVQDAGATSIVSSCAICAKVRRQGGHGEREKRGERPCATPAVQMFAYGETEDGRRPTHYWDSRCRSSLSLFVFRHSATARHAWPAGAARRSSIFGVFTSLPSTPPPAGFATSASWPHAAAMRSLLLLLPCRHGRIEHNEIRARSESTQYPTRLRRRRDAKHLPSLFPLRPASSRATSPRLPHSAPHALPRLSPISAQAARNENARRAKQPVRRWLLGPLPPYPRPPHLAPLLVHSPMFSVSHHSRAHSVRSQAADGSRTTQTIPARTESTEDTTQWRWKSG